MIRNLIFAAASAVMKYIFPITYTTSLTTSNLAVNDTTSIVVTYLTLKNAVANESASVNGFLITEYYSNFAKFEYWTGSVWLEADFNAKNYVLGTTNKLLTGSDPDGNTILSAQYRLTPIIGVLGLKPIIKIACMVVNTTTNTATQVNGEYSTQSANIT